MARVYLDSCIVIYLVEGAADVQVPVREAIQNARGMELCISDLVRMECRVSPLRRGDTDTLSQFERFFSLTTVLPLTPDVFDLAAEPRATKGCRTPDALHLAAAIRHGCREFWTNDLRLADTSAQITMRVLPEGHAK